MRTAAITHTHLAPFLFLFWVGLSCLCPEALAEKGNASSERVAANNQALARKILNEMEPGEELVTLGCMVFHIEQIRALAGEGKAAFIQEADVPDVTFYWPDGIVPYTFDPAGIEDGTIDALGRTAMGRKELIREAIAAWEGAAALSFIEVPFDNPGYDNYLIFKDSDSSNSSMVGKFFLPSPQDVNMVSWDHPSTNWIIVNELGHALGMFHEQSRSDRDNFVDILEENIQEGEENNFELQVDSDNVGDYDFDSIMHYPHNAFGIDGQTTIEPLPAYEEFKFAMGQRDHLSDADKLGMIEQYGARQTAFVPTFSPPSGNYSAPVDFRLSVFPSPRPSPLDARYYYTLDGTTPTTDSLEYLPGDIIPTYSRPPKLIEVVL